MIYLDNAATTFPKPDSVLRTVSGIMERLCANPGRSGHRMSLAAGRIVVNCRETLAQFLNVEDPERIIFCFNCTDAINLALHGFLQAGDHVLATSLDHNASLRPLYGMMRRGMISLDVLEPGPNGYVTESQVRHAIQSNTRLMVCVHASNVTGMVQPVAEISRACHEHGVKLLVDAAQTAGILNVSPDLLGADFLAFPGHKGLLGPMGTGVLWIREGIELIPYREGGTGSQSERVDQPDELPDRFESGTLNLVGIAGLLQGVRFVMAHQGEIAAHEEEMARYTHENLANLDHALLYTNGPPNVGVISFNLEGNRSGEIADTLNKYGIGIRAGLHCAPLAHRFLGTLDTGAARVSPGFFNQKSDIDRLISVIARI